MLMAARTGASYETWGRPVRDPEDEVIEGAR
jgi:hypothetical protein